MARWLRGVLQAAGGIVVIAVVLSTTRQVSSPTLVYSEAIGSSVAEDSSESVGDRAGHYAWLSKSARRSYEPLARRIETPPGYTRVAVPARSFADWLRHLPVAPEEIPVTTARGEVVLAAKHPNLAAVVALQPHGRRLLNAANMMIRLRAEHGWTTGRLDGLAFHFTSGHRSGWQAWASGIRASVRGREVAFRRKAPADDSRDSFCCWLETVFRYATTYSLLDDTRPAEDQAVEPGDILLRRGRPGHALMVLDIATNDDGRVRVLLGQGGTPAQTFHVLRNDAGSAWFPITRDGKIDLGERGDFTLKNLRHWVG